MKTNASSPGPLPATSAAPGRSKAVGFCHSRAGNVIVWVSWLFSVQVYSHDPGTPISISRKGSFTKSETVEKTMKQCKGHPGRNLLGHTFENDDKKRLLEIDVKLRFRFRVSVLTI